MYLASMVLKHYDNAGQPAADLPVVEWACRNLLYRAQEQLHGFLRNFPNRFLAGLMRLLIFPRGLTYFGPSTGSRARSPTSSPHPPSARASWAPIYTTLNDRSPLGAAAGSAAAGAMPPRCSRNASAKRV